MADTQGFSRRGWFGALLGAVVGAKVALAAKISPAPVYTPYLRKAAMERLQSKFVFRKTEKTGLVPSPGSGGKVIWVRPNV